MFCYDKLLNVYLIQKLHLTSKDNKNLNLYALELKRKSADPKITQEKCGNYLKLQKLFFIKSTN
jgi:hypothetical protein